MSIDFATLGLAADTSGLKKGEDDLKSLTATGAKTEQQVNASMKAIGTGAEASGRRVSTALMEVNSAFRLNRIGMMELQAAGINSFQAIASGMSPMRVAMMEGSQVMGAFVQGTEGGLAGMATAVRGAAASFVAFLGPIGLTATALTAVAGIAWYESFHKATVDITAATGALTALKTQVKALDAANKAAAQTMPQLFAQYGTNASIAAKVLDNQLQVAVLNTQDAMVKLNNTLSGAFGSITYQKPQVNPFGSSVGAITSVLESKQAAAMGGLNPEAVNRIADTFKIGKDAAQQFADALKQLGQARAPDQVVQATEAARTALLNAAGSIANMNDQERKFYDLLLQVEAKQLHVSQINMAGNIGAAADQAQRYAAYMTAISKLQAGNVSGANAYEAGGPDAARLASMSYGPGMSARVNAILPISTTTSGGTSGPGAHHIAAMTAQQKAMKAVVSDLTGNLSQYQMMLGMVDAAQRKTGASAFQAAQETASLKEKILESTSAGKFYAQSMQTFESSMSKAIVTGGSLSSVLSNLASSFAEAAAQAALFGTGPFGGGSVASGGGLLGGIFSAVGGLFGGGSSLAPTTSPTPALHFASGTSYAPGGMALVGENGPEIVNIPRGAQVVPSRQTASMLGGTVRVEGGHLTLTDDGTIAAHVQVTAARTTQAGLSHYDSVTFPQSFHRVSQNPDLVGA